MAGYDDSRYLKQVIDDLQKRLKALEGSALQLGINQKGPLPGYMRAVQINDVGQASSMWINMRGNQPGSSPYSAVSDANGKIRAEWGNLAANGNSPAQFGFRANDANSNPIFDSLGLIGVMTQLGHVDFASGSFGNLAPPQVILGSTINFTLARPTRILAMASSVLYTNSGAPAGQNGVLTFFLDGVDQESSWPAMAIGANQTSMITAAAYFSNSLAAGSHTIDVRGYVSNAAVIVTVQTLDVVVWQLGN